MQVWNLIIKMLFMYFQLRFWCVEPTGNLYIPLNTFGKKRRRRWILNKINMSSIMWDSFIASNQIYISNKSDFIFNTSFLLLLSIRELILTPKVIPKYLQLMRTRYCEFYYISRLTMKPTNTLFVVTFQFLDDKDVIEEVQTRHCLPISN